MKNDDVIHIAFDLELEQSKNNPQTPDSKLSEAKIIQIGWCVFKCAPFEILEKKEFDINIKVPLSAFIKKLTGIKDEQIRNGVSLEYAFEELNKDVDTFKCCRVLKQWGGGDQCALRSELKKDVDWKFGHSAFNVKHFYQAFAEANGLNRSGGLKKSMNRCKQSFEGRAHGALVDAVNTAKFYDFLKSNFKLIKDL